MICPTLRAIEISSLARKERRTLPAHSMRGGASSHLLIGRKLDDRPSARLLYLGAAKFGTRDELRFLEPSAGMVTF